MQWIEQAADAEVLKQWSKDSAIAVDTEFMRERTFYPELALVQIGRPGEVVLLDAPRLGRTPALIELLQAPVLKVMHSAGEDLQAFQHALGAVPRPLFDTQLAAGLCGMDPSLSYQKLVAELCSVTLEKGETRSDWLRRPLSQSQLTYAADDVRYLLDPYQQLALKLEGLGRRQWLDEDCERALEQAREGDDPLPHLSVRPAQGLPREVQVRLWRLLRWRDQLARSSNKPRSWMLDTQLAVDLALRPAPDRTTLDRQLDAHPKAPRKRREELFDLLQSGLSPEEQALPLAAQPDPSERDQLKKLQNAVAQRAAALGIHDSVLASRRHLETLLREGRWSRHLSGWRRRELAAHLVPLLPGSVRLHAEHA